MLYVSYLRELASQYLELGDRALKQPPSGLKSVPKAVPGSGLEAADEYRELAEICTRVAADLEDHSTAG